MAIKNYFYFDVPTSEWLLTAAKLIAYATEVTFIFPQIPEKLSDDF